MNEEVAQLRSIAERLRDLGQCDCFAREAGECACGAWDGSKHSILAHEIDLLAQVVLEQLPQGECICPKCGIRHGLTSKDGGF